MKAVEPKERPFAGLTYEQVNVFNQVYWSLNALHNVLSSSCEQDLARLSCLLNPICNGLDELDAAINGRDKQKAG